jgi:hypothetical protein
MGLHEAAQQRTRMFEMSQEPRCEECGKPATTLEERGAFDRVYSVSFDICGEIDWADQIDGEEEVEERHFLCDEWSCWGVKPEELQGEEQAAENTV